MNAEGQKQEENLTLEDEENLEDERFYKDLPSLLRKSFKLIRNVMNELQQLRKAVESLKKEKSPIMERHFFREELSELFGISVGGVQKKLDRENIPTISEGQEPIVPREGVVRYFAEKHNMPWHEAEKLVPRPIIKPHSSGS